MASDFIAGLATLDADFMPDTCTVLHTTPGPDNPDGSPGDGTTVLTPYPCRVGTLGNSPMEQVIAARLTDVTGFVVTLPWDASVSEKDTIAYNGQVLQVLGVLNPTTFMTSVRAVCRRIT